MRPLAKMQENLMNCLLSFQATLDVLFVSRQKSGLFHSPQRRTLEGTEIYQTVRIIHLSI